MEVSDFEPDEYRWGERHAHYRCRDGAICSVLSKVTNEKDIPAIVKRNYLNARLCIGNKGQVSAVTVSDLLLSRDMSVVFGIAAQNARSLVVPTSVQLVKQDAFKGNTTIQQVFLKDNVTVLQEGCFKDSNIKVIRLSKRLSTIGREAFMNCANLKNVNFYEGLSIIHNFAFANSKIQVVNIPGTVR